MIKRHLIVEISLTHVILFYFFSGCQVTVFLMLTYRLLLAVLVYGRSLLLLLLTRLI